MNHTKCIYGWSNMQHFGINMLTGESCSFSMRLLCDLNEKGRELVSEYLGIRLESFAPAWNSTVNEAPAVASVMLHRASLPQIAEFAFFRDNALAVMTTPEGSILGLYEQDRVEQWAERITKFAPAGSLRRNGALKASTASVSTRNVHAFTGRSA